MTEVPIQQKQNGGIFFFFPNLHLCLPDQNEDLAGGVGSPGLEAGMRLAQIIPGWPGTCLTPLDLSMPVGTRRELGGRRGPYRQRAALPWP